MQTADESTIAEKAIVCGIACSVACAAFAVAAAILLPITGSLLAAVSAPAWLHIPLVLLGAVGSAIIGAVTGAAIGSKMVLANRLEADERGASSRSIHCDFGGESLRHR
jgi:predicted membrane-bound spermidine synthase